MADQYKKKPFHIVFANPFSHFEDVYSTIARAMDRSEVSGRKNFTFHRQTTHPLVNKKGPAMVPGWNASNDEITATGRHGCYVLFDKEGQLVFQGRQTFDEIEARVKRLLAR